MKNKKHPQNVFFSGLIKSPRILAHEKIKSDNPQKVFLLKNGKNWIQIDETNPNRIFNHCDETVFLLNPADNKSSCKQGTEGDAKRS